MPLSLFQLFINRPRDTLQLSPMQTAVSMMRSCHVFQNKGPNAQTLHISTPTTKTHTKTQWRENHNVKMHAFTMLFN